MADHHDNEPSTAEHKEAHSTSCESGEDHHEAKAKKQPKVNIPSLAVRRTTINLEKDIAARKKARRD